MNRTPQPTDMTLEQFAATFPLDCRPTNQTLRNWNKRVGGRKLNFFRPGKTPFVTQAEAERFKAACME